MYTICNDLQSQHKKKEGYTILLWIVGGGGGGGWGGDLEGDHTQYFTIQIKLDDFVCTHKKEGT